MAKIFIDGTQCSIKEESDTEFLRLLDKELSFKVQGAEHTRAFKGYYSHGEYVKWDGVHRILTRRLMFPYGLLDRVVSFYHKHGKPIHVEDRRDPHTPVSTIEIHKRLIEINRDPYPYQWETLDTVKENDCGIIRIATGGGKCNAKDSLNFSEFGLLSYEELLADKGISLQPQEAVNYTSKVATPLTKNHLDKTGMIYRDGYGKSLHVKTRYGYELKATPAHRIKVLTDDGVVWKRFEDLQVNDYAVISNNINVFGSFGDFSLEEAYWCGLLLGDGGYSNMSYIGFTNEDQYLLDFVRSYLNSQDLGFVDKKTNNDTYDIRVNNVVYRKYALTKYGFKPCLSINKEIPVELRKLTKPLLAMVIRGLYETDGWVGKEKSKPTINIALSSKKMIDQLHLILLNYGVVASRRLKKTTHEDSHQLTIYREFIPKFVQEIGFHPNGRKFNELEREIDLYSETMNSNTNLVYNQTHKIRKLYQTIKASTGNLTASFGKYGVNYGGAPRSWAGECAWRNPGQKSLKQVLLAALFIADDCDLDVRKEIQEIVQDLLYLCTGDFFFDPIVSIEETTTDNYDFVVPETHSFVSQGFVNHNTLIAAMMASHFGKRSIIYVIGKDLLHQIHRFFSNIFDHKIGIIGDGLCEIHDINVASVWTIGQALGLEKSKILLDTIDSEDSIDKSKYRSILNLMREAKVHIFDECHLAACDTIQEIARKINPEYVYGMSASPWRDDGADLLIEGIFGSTIVDISASYLIRGGFLVKPYIKFIEVPPLGITLPRKYPTVYKHYVIDNVIRNEKIITGAERMVDQGFKPLILYTRLNHGKKLFQDVSKKFPAMLLSGKDSQEIREQAKKRLETGEIQGIVASTIFDIGVDLPALSGLIIAGGGKSSVRACQRIGRVIRKHTGKACAAVLDFYDQACFLKQHSIIRYKIYSSEEEFDVTWPT
jgi:superfamily II DNA or RNA helicase/intein/homing endonuclease